ncbi:MAG: radical SAM protein [Phycisphaerales bacterium]|nr:MAG: radical SAM protein [Phycisphaerales bacterium]
MTEKMYYLYGPVSSRRLGRSLGVDIMPHKICTLDCIYCQLGRSTQKSIERREYVPVAAVLAAIKQKVKEGLDADFITIGGSGEPTLNSGLGRLIGGIKGLSNIPVALLTNGTLLFRKDVRDDCAKADVLLPSLDAGDEETFQRMNRPHQDISIEKLVAGLCAFRAGFAGKIWLEVFLVEGLNTDDEQIGRIARLIERIRPDKIHLNTAVRPTAEAHVARPGSNKLRHIAARLGPKCEVIADFSPKQHGARFVGGAADVLSMLKRRPCSLEQICSGLRIRQDEALQYINILRKRGAVESTKKDGKTFFKASSKRGRPGGGGR